MLSPPTLVIASLVLATNLLAWAAFRLDKARARRGTRRLRERTLLWLSAFGGFGALAGMYLHRRRHKVDKRRFALTVWILTVLQVALPITLALGLR